MSRSWPLSWRASSRDCTVMGPIAMPNCVMKVPMVGLLASGTTP